MKTAVPRQFAGASNVFLRNISSVGLLINCNNRPLPPLPFNCQ